MLKQGGPQAHLLPLLLCVQLLYLRLALDVLQQARSLLYSLGQQLRVIPLPEPHFNARSSQVPPAGEQALASLLLHRELDVRRDLRLLEGRSGCLGRIGHRGRRVR